MQVLQRLRLSGVEAKLMADQAIAKAKRSAYRAVEVGTGLGLSVAAGVATAAPTSPFDTVIASATDAVGGYGAALVTLSGVAILFWIAIKYVKKITGAS